MKWKVSIKQAGKVIFQTLPILVGVILLVGLANTVIPKEVYGEVFSGNILTDSIIGDAVGSVLAGNPITSYIISGELLNQGISLIAVTAFMVAWVTVGIVSFPAEALLLGRKFAIVRNVSAFFLAIAVAIVTVTLVNLI